MKNTIAFSQTQHITESLEHRLASLIQWYDGTMSGKITLLSVKNCTSLNHWTMNGMISPVFHKHTTLVIMPKLVSGKQKIPAIKCKD